MPRVLLTGMSGSGKSTLLRTLAAYGVTVVDADDDAWSRWQPGPDGEPDWMWDESSMARLLDAHGTLVVAGCSANQGRFYDRFEHVVLLDAPVDVLLERVQRRTDNPFGSTPEQRTKIARDAAEVVPLLRRGADLELDARRDVDDLVAELRRLLAR
ncbi:MAG TPA: AAA family ATPase [Candidatus Nanopelagicales bacterium]|nr:AAA family ATPase [Candidatus Nanopelagicales bacterium]